MSGKTILVETNSGPIRGGKRISFMNDEFYSFKGIPYAEPPIGELRFKNPRPVKPWILPIDCTIEQVPCSYHLDMLTNKIVGSEDCLFINVFTKNIKPKKLIPVMVWIHGGAFLRGSSNEDWYGPDYLLQKNILLVTFNYRLGALGFLSIDEPSINVPGNAGLKDQSMALRWIKENIKCFGGDPTNITIFGESAGGCSVHYHLISEQSNGLFHKAILMSGCALNNWSLVPKKDFAERLAIAVGWDEQGEIDEAFEMLQNAKPEDIVKAQSWILSPDDVRNSILFPFGPIIEPYETDHQFITSDPVLLCRTAWSNNIPIIIGSTSDEGLYKLREAMENPKILKTLGNFEHMVPIELNLDRESAECRAIGIKMRKFYFKDEEPSTKSIHKYVDLMSDKLFWHGIHRTILSRLKYRENSNVPTYLYRFNFDSESFNHFRVAFCPPGTRGSCHADDLSYLFKNQFVKNIVVNSDEYNTINRMVGIFTNFAIKSNPNDDHLRNMQWNPVTDQQPFKCLNISNKLSIINLPETKRMSFWDSIYPMDRLV